MVRARNEEEFLYASVKSIVDHVEEVVITDNDSQDSTPQIISRLCREHPDKITTHHYPHAVRKVGKDNWELAENERTRSSPHLSANYYNSCLARCHGTHVLKWDADMVATPLLHRELAGWRTSDSEVMMFFGGNIHPNRLHLIRARVTDDEKLLAQLQFRGMPEWVSSLTYDSLEPRLFPRTDAVYASGPWTQKLVSPHLRSGQAYEVDTACFLHLKFCKRDPLANYSSDLAGVIAANIDVGPALDPAWSEALQRWGLAGNRLHDADSP